MVTASWVFVNIVGNFGVVLIILAYLLLALKKVNPNRLPYLFLNLIGAICILVSLSFKFNLPAFVIEVCWILISAYSIVIFTYKALKKKWKKPGETDPTTEPSPDQSDISREGDVSPVPAGDGLVGDNNNDDVSTLVQDTRIEIGS